MVCGGFATPVTRGFTDRIYVVTSGEQASLLAANNILAGMNAVGGRVGGLIYNARGFKGEDVCVERFSERTGTPVVGRMPYSQRIKLEEMNRRAICEAEDARPENDAIRALAGALLGDAPCALSLIHISGRSKPIMAAMVAGSSIRRRPRSMRTPAPVSYTHLDVYKRQGMCHWCTASPP